MIINNHEGGNKALRDLSLKKENKKIHFFIIFLRKRLDILGNDCYYINRMPHSSV